MQNSDQTPPTSRLIVLSGSRPHFPEEVRTRVETGARLVRFEFCFSLLFVTIRRQSKLYLTDSWKDRYLCGLCYSFIALILGPWGVPWCLIWTLWAVWVNLPGGVDDTDYALGWIEACVKTESDHLRTAASPGSHELMRCKP